MFCFVVVFMFFEGEVPKRRWITYYVFCSLLFLLHRLLMTLKFRPGQWRWAETCLIPRGPLQGVSEIVRYLSERAMTWFIYYESFVLTYSRQNLLLKNGEINKLLSDQSPRNIRRTNDVENYCAYLTRPTTDHQHCWRTLTSYPIKCIWVKMHLYLFSAVKNTSKPISSRSTPYLTDNLPECITVNSWVNAPRLEK